MCKNDDDDDRSDDSHFDDESTRRRFIAKVCGILALQLLFTAAVVAGFVVHEPAADWLRENWWLLLIAIAVEITVLIMLCYCVRFFRRAPCNFILLFFLTSAMTISLSYMCIEYAPTQILAAVLTTAGLFVLLALFAIFAPCGFTGCGPILFLLSLIMSSMGILLFIYPDRILYWVLCCLGVLAYSIHVVVDIQKMVGGRHKHKFYEKDYVIAALCIYIDIIRLLQWILRICGLMNDDDDDDD